MFRAKFDGAIANAYADQLRQLSKEQIIQMYIDSEIASGKLVGSVQQGKRARVLGKQEKTATKNKKIQMVYLALKAKDDKKIPLKGLLKELRKEYPTEQWKDGGVKNVLTDLKKGKRF